MTNEEAIKVLNMVKAHGIAEEAKQMAIKALSQELSGEYKVVEKILFYLDGREKVANDEWVSFEFKELQKFIRECLKEMSIQALSQEPCDNAVSRILTKMWNCRGKHTTSIDKVAMEQIIRDELSVTQKSGKWIKIQSGDKDFPESIVCSKCGSENSHLDFNENAEPIGKVFVTSKYCPNCGAKMEGSDKE